MSEKAGKPSRISLEELKRRAGKAELSEAEIRAYFAEDKDNSEPFKPAVKVDTRNVDTGGKTLSPEKTAELYQQATRTPKKAVEGAVEVSHPKVLTATAKTMAKSAKAKGARVLGEGDSWFNLPSLIYPPTALDILAETHDVRSIALWGDELDNMVATKQYLQPLKSGAFRHFLFSGGGNDVLGSIGKFVKNRKPDDTDPANAPGYVNNDFATKIAAMIGLYKTLAKDVRIATQGGTVLYVHGYANAVPRKNGPYIGTPLAAKGFDPDTVGPLAKAIVKHMVAMFNAALKNFAAGQSAVVYVDVRPAMNAADWLADEIHPRKSGAEKIAALFREAIAKNNLVA